jgi:hypothetical protein
MDGESENPGQLSGRCFASSGKALFFGSHLRCSPFGPASPFAPSAQWASKRNELARQRESI